MSIRYWLLGPRCDPDHRTPGTGLRSSQIIPVPSSDRRPLARLSSVALLSCAYDVAIGFALLFGREWLARSFGIPSPQPPIFVELNSVFLLAVGIGYLLPYTRPERYRGYLWVMGPLLKGGGAIAFIADHYVHASPRTFLLFAASDGFVALLTVWALVTTRTVAPRSGVSSTDRVESRRP